MNVQTSFTNRSVKTTFVLHVLFSANALIHDPQDKKKHETCQESFFFEKDGSKMHESLF